MTAILAPAQAAQRLLMLALLTTPLSAVTPTWTAGSGKWSACERVTTVFGVTVCLSPNAWADGLTKNNHVVNIIYQLLDNDADGVVDDSSVVTYMVDNDYYMIVAATEGDSESWNPPNTGRGQLTGCARCGSPNTRLSRFPGAASPSRASRD